MLELSASGARVLMLRSVEYARNHGVKLHVRSSFTVEEGTWIEDMRFGPRGPLMVQALKEKGLTIVLVEQNFRFAAPLADRHYVLEHGRIVHQVEQHDLQSNMERLHELLGL